MIVETLLKRRAFVDTEVRGIKGPSTIECVWAKTVWARRWRVDLHQFLLLLLSHYYYYYYFSIIIIIIIIIIITLALLLAQQHTWYDCFDFQFYVLYGGFLPNNL
jgi:hypothetical protein